MVLAEPGRTEESLAAYDKALRLDPDQVQIAQEREALLTQRGRREERRTVEVPSLPLPKIFRFPPTGRYRVVSLLLPLWGFCLLALGAVVLRLIILNPPPLPLLVGAIVLIMVLLVQAALVLRATSFVRGSTLLLTSEGILYNAVSFQMYTPWSNLRGVGGGKWGIPFSGLVLREPALVDRKVGEGLQQGVAVIELTRWMIGKKDFKKKCPFLHILPIDMGLVGNRWWQGEFGSYLRQYAPQVVDQRPTL